MQRGGKEEQPLFSQNVYLDQRNRYCGSNHAAWMIAQGPAFCFFWLFFVILDVPWVRSRCRDHVYTGL